MPLHGRVHHHSVRNPAYIVLNTKNNSRPAYQPKAGCIPPRFDVETLRGQSSPWRFCPHSHGGVSVAQRAGISIHIVTDNGRRVTERHDRHGIGDGRGGGIGPVIEAGIISEAGRIAPLPLDGC